MDKRPIRRKFKDNPYRLDSIEKKEIYIINFKDGKGQSHSIQVDKKVFDVFDEEEKYENARFYEYAKYIEHSEIEINNIKDRKSLEDKVINKFTILELKNAIDNLPEIQRRRILKYFFENKTYEEIAKEEFCTKRAVKFSIDIALEKISKKLRN